MTESGFHSEHYGPGKWEPGQSTNDGTDQWPQPHPLPDSLMPVAAFGLELAPDETRRWLADVCERMQCPSDYTQSR
jgi:putative DNA primase/helicase